MELTRAVCYWSSPTDLFWYAERQSTASASVEEEPGDDEEDSGSDWDETSSDEDVNATLAGVDDGAREAAVVAFVAELSYGVGTSSLCCLSCQIRSGSLPF